MNEFRWRGRRGKGETVRGSSYSLRENTGAGSLHFTSITARETAKLQRTQRHWRRNFRTDKPCNKITQITGVYWKCCSPLIFQCQQQPQLHHQGPSASASSSARLSFPRARDHFYQALTWCTFHFSEIFKSLAHFTQIIGYNLTDLGERNKSGINNHF